MHPCKCYLISTSMQLSYVAYPFKNESFELKSLKYTLDWVCQLLFVSKQYVRITPQATELTLSIPSVVSLKYKSKLRSFHFEYISLLMNTQVGM